MIPIFFLTSHTRDQTYTLIMTKNTISKLFCYLFYPGDHPKHFFQAFVVCALIRSGPNLNVHIFRVCVVLGKAVRKKIDLTEPLGLCVLFGGECEAERDLWSVRL